MIQQQDILYGTICTSGQPGPVGPPGPAGGVVTWNTRNGEVMPQTGDYNAPMVGAVAESDKITNAEILSLFD